MGSVSWKELLLESAPTYTATTFDWKSDGFISVGMGVPRSIGDLRPEAFAEYVTTAVVRCMRGMLKGSPRWPPEFDRTVIDN